MLISFKQLTTEFNREPPIRWQVAEKRYGMLREPQHERNFLNHFEPLSVRPEPVEGLRESFSDLLAMLAELKAYALARAGCAPTFSLGLSASGHSGATGLTSTVAP